MKEWFENLSVMEHIYLWLGVVATLFLIVQIILMLCSSVGGDFDVDGDGDIDVDNDSGVSIFTLKSVTAFFAVGAWAGLLVCSVISQKLQWVSIPVAVAAGAAAMFLVVVVMRAISKLQCNGALQTEKLVGKHATVYVSVPPLRSGRGKVTLNAQGRYTELDAVTEGAEKIPVDEIVEIVAVEDGCTVVKRTSPEEKINLSEEENV